MNQIAFDSPIKVQSYVLTLVTFEQVIIIALHHCMQDIIWLENEIVFVLTRDRTLYRSDTDGRSFENVMGMLEDSSVEEPPFENGVAAMYPSDADSGRVFFQGHSPTCPQ